MTRILLRRAAVLPVLLLGVTLLVFLLVHLIPGDPARQLAGGPRATQEAVEQVRAEYGFDEPLPAQYAKYIERLVQGDMGSSLGFKEPVTTVLGDRIPATFELLGAALLIGVPAGLLLGIQGARRRYSWADHATSLLSIAGLSIPIFWLGLMLAWLVSVELGWLPLYGRLPAFTTLEPITGINTIDALLRGQWSTFWGSLRYLALPAITLAILPMAMTARFTRASFIEILGQGYITTARAYGLSERRIIWRHAAKNALLPVVTMLGVIVPALLAGGVLVENVFSWPGIGTVLQGALLSRDYAMVQGVSLFVAVCFILATALVDVSYTVLDPRTRRA